MSEEQHNPSGNPSKPTPTPVKPEGKQPLPDDARPAVALTCLDDKPVYSLSFSVDSDAAQIALLHAVKQGNLSDIDLLLKSGVPVVDDRILFHAIRRRSSEIFWRLWGKANVQIQLEGYSLAELIALDCPWSPSEKQEALEKLEEKEVTLGHPIFRKITGGEQISSAEIAKLIFLKDRYHHSIAHYCAANNCIELLKSLDSALLIAENHDGITPLILAAAQGHEEVVKILLQKNAPINARSKKYGIPLHAAAARGHVEVVQLLLEKHARISVIDHIGNTALHHAARNGHNKVVMHLLQKGAKVNAQTTDGATAFDIAAWEGHVDIMQLLLEEHRASIANQTKKAALYKAVANGRVAAVKFLLENGVSINTRNEYDLTALHCAASEGRLEMVKFLLQNGAEIESQSRNGTVLHIAANRGHVHVVCYLLQNGASIEAQTSDGMTPLHTAASGGHVEVMRLLKHRGAAMNERSIRGSTPLMFAAFEGHIAAVKWLLHECGAQVTEKNQEDFSVLMAAAWNGNKELIFLLVRDYGADITEKDRHGEGVMELVTHNGKRAAPFELTTLKDLRAEYYKKQLADALKNLIEPHLNFTLPKVLIQIVIDYFSPYRLKEFHFFMGSMKKREFVDEEAKTKPLSSLALISRSSLFVGENKQKVPAPSLAREQEAKVPTQIVAPAVSIALNRRLIGNASPPPLTLMLPLPGGVGGLIVTQNQAEAEEPRPPSRQEMS